MQLQDGPLRSEVPFSLSQRRSVRNGRPRFSGEHNPLNLHRWWSERFPEQAWPRQRTCSGKEDVWHRCRWVEGGDRDCSFSQKSRFTNANKEAGRDGYTVNGWRYLLLGLSCHVSVSDKILRRDRSGMRIGGSEAEIDGKTYSTMLKTNTCNDT